MYLTQVWLNVRMIHCIIKSGSEIYITKLSSFIINLGYLHKTNSKLLDLPYKDKLRLLLLITYLRWTSLLWLGGGAPPWYSGSMLDHRSLPPVFKSRRGHIWRLFHLWLRFITLCTKVAVKHQLSSSSSSFMVKGIVQLHFKFSGLIQLYS